MTVNSTEALEGVLREKDLPQFAEGLVESDAEKLYLSLGRILFGFCHVFEKTGTYQTCDHGKDDHHNYHLDQCESAWSSFLFHLHTPF